MEQSGQTVLNVLPKYKNKQEIAYEEIKNAIIQCRFQPGDSLVIRTLAAQLGISEIPVREALKRLISENFVVESQSGLSISPISISEFLDMLDIKLNLEIIAIKLSAKKITDAQIQYLTHIWELMEKHCKENDLKSYLQEHSQFHLECCMMCGISYLMSALTAAFSHHKRAINYFNLSLWKEQPALQEHSDILHALVHHDPEEAQKCLCKNRERADNFYRKQIAEIMSRE